MTEEKQRDRCNICGADLLHVNKNLCKNFHIQKADKPTLDTDEFIITGFQLRQLQKYSDLDFVCQAIHSRPYNIDAVRKEEREKVVNAIKFDVINKTIPSDHNAVIQKQVTLNIIESYRQRNGEVKKDE